MTTDIHGTQRQSHKQELDKIAREILYSLATQFRELLKDDNTIEISDVYSILTEASQHLFQRAITVTNSTKTHETTNYSCPHFEALKNLHGNAPVPNECSVCPKLMQCFIKRTEV